MNLDPATIQQAKRVDLLALMRGASIKKTGAKDYRGTCPICGSGSFCAQPSEHRWTCNCVGRRWSDAVDFVREREHLDFAEAVKWLTAGNVSTQPVAQPQQRQAAPKYWQQTPDQWLKPALAAPDRLASWQSYKPVSMATIAKYQLGVGKQPGVPCKHRRLIIPVFVDGKLVNFRGRSFCCSCTGWMTSASGPVLYGLEEVRPPDTVYWVENNVDALLVSQGTPCRGVASTHGAYSWRGLAEQLAARQPHLVIVALDNDQAGNPNRETWQRINAEHRAKTGRNLPQPNGPQIAEALQKLGVAVHLWSWEVEELRQRLQRAKLPTDFLDAGIPKGADMGWLLMSQSQKKEARAA
jgi:ribosomal protein S27AE